MSVESGLDIAIVGSGISGLSAAWLLSKRHRVTLFEADGRIGGHSHTVMAAGVPVDTGFIVYNEPAYPNLTALFRHLDVATKPTEMSFSVSLDRGRLEYSGTDLGGLFAQRRNLASPRFWSMLRDLERFYRRAPRDLPEMGSIGLGTYLDGLGCGAAFRNDHLYPMAAAIWSTPVSDIPDYPAAAFVRFCENHGLLRLGRRPAWRTVEGGSREYVERLTRPFADRIVRQRRVLRAFGYRRNEAVLHADPSLMPQRRRVWSSWNYASEGRGEEQALSVTYWMNRLQGIAESHPLFVTLNPLHEPAAELVHRRDVYQHPVFDSAAGAAQARLWSLQGVRNTWFCGSYFGSGFHEDGLQAGLAVAEQLGGVRRPWTVAGESDRIQITTPAGMAVAA